MSDSTSEPVDPAPSADLVGRWVLDPARSTIGFRHKTMWGMATVKGTFATAEASGEVAPDGTVGGVLTIDAASLETGNAPRDKHLRGPEFFDAEHHPGIVFTVGQVVRESKETVQVTGELAVAGTSRPLSFPATARYGAETVTLTAALPVDRADFGLTWNRLGMLTGQTDVDVSACFTRVTT
jgi:polyisoprenoid-binding protein YceI